MTNETSVKGATNVSTATLLSGKTRHDRKKARPNTNKGIEQPTKAASVSIESLQEQLNAAKAQLSEAKKAAKVAGKSKQVAYLNEGVTGKQLATTSKGLGNAINEEALSLSKVLNLVKNHVNKSGFIVENGVKVATPALIAMFPNAKVSDITPANLLVYRTTAQIAKGKEQLAKYGYERFTVAAVRSWAVSFYKAKNGYVKAVKVVK